MKFLIWRIRLPLEIFHKRQGNWLCVILVVGAGLSARNFFYSTFKWYSLRTDFTPDFAIFHHSLNKDFSLRLTITLRCTHELIESLWIISLRCHANIWNKRFSSVFNADHIILGEDRERNFEGWDRGGKVEYKRIHTKRGKKWLFVFFILVNVSFFGKSEKERNVGHMILNRLWQFLLDF